MRRVTAVGKIKDTDEETGQHHNVADGDSITVSDACARRWCAMGWANDTTGEFPTGERIPGARAPLVVHDLTAGSE